VVSSSKLEISKNNDIFAPQDESITFSLQVGNRLSRDVVSYSHVKKNGNLNTVTYPRARRYVPDDSSGTKYNAIRKVLDLILSLSFTVLS